RGRHDPSRRRPQAEPGVAPSREGRGGLDTPRCCGERLPRDLAAEHLRRRRRLRPLSVHAFRRVPGPDRRAQHPTPAATRARADEMSHELALAMQLRVDLSRLSTLIHVYPTLSQAVQRVADSYMRTRLTPKARRIFGWLYGRQRSGA